jgi:hypothetical protein
VHVLRGGRAKEGQSRSATSEKKRLDETYLERAGLAAVTVTEKDESRRRASALCTDALGRTSAARPVT